MTLERLLTLTTAICLGLGSGLVQQAAAKTSAPTTAASAHAKYLHAYTANRRFLVKLKVSPSPIPFERYFSMQVQTYAADHPDVRLSGAHVDIHAGMRHGRKHGFAHGMQSAPRLRDQDGLFTVSGMFFHMRGPWTVDISVDDKGQRGTAEFTLPCCE